MKRPGSVAFILFVVFFAVRLFGIEWGLPNDLHNQSFHPDESFIVQNYAYRMEPGLLQLTPGNYNYPTLYPLMIRIAGDVVSTYSGVERPPAPQSISNAQQLEDYLINVGRHERLVNIAGRVISSLAGAGTAAVVFLFLFRFTGMISALLGGSLMGIAPAFLVQSRYQTVDVTSTFFFVLAIYYAVKILPPVYGEDGEPNYLKLSLLCGLFAGLSAGTKYTGFIALLSLWLVLAVAKPPKAWALATYALLASIVVFVLTTPGALLDTAQFMHGVNLEVGHMSAGHGFAFVSTPPGFIYHLGNLLTGIGPLAAVIGLAGLAAGAAKRHVWMWALLAAMIPYYVLIGRSEVKFIRYALPLFPAVCIGFGYAVGGAIRRPNLRLVGLAAGLVGLLGIDSAAAAAIERASYAQCFDLRFGGLYGAAKYTGYMMSEHPEDQAARYLKEEAKTGQCKLVGLYRHPWFWTVPVIRDANYLYTEKPQTISLLVSLAHDPDVDYASMQPPADHIAWTAFEVDPIRNAAGNPDNIPAEQKVDFPGLNSLRLSIENNYTVEKTFGGDIPDVEDLMYIHPRVEVLRHK